MTDGSEPSIPLVHPPSMFDFEKLPGLPRDRVIAAIEPVLAAHRVRGVELVWRMDNQGRVLLVSVEPAQLEQAGPEGEANGQASQSGASEGGASEGGVTLETIAQLSRDLSTALDVADAIGGKYRLEVGSPGLERGLYSPWDYRRFAGKLAKLKLSAPIDGQSSFRGRLAGVDENNNIRFQPEDGGAEDGLLQIPFEAIRTGQLMIDDEALGLAPNRYAPRASRRRSPAAGRR